MALRITFMGTPEFSVPVLNALSEAGHNIVACYTQPPRPAGRRGLELVPSPVQKTAEQLGIPVFYPTSLKGTEALTQFESHRADVAVVVAYGMLLPQAILDTPKYGCLNGHASLLPRWRGAAPIQRAIMSGDAETGIMIMKMEAGLDTGPIGLTARIAINSTTTAGSLHNDLSNISADLMVKAMSALETGTMEWVPQGAEGVSYAHKIAKDETRVDWSKPAEQVHGHIMGLSPFPGAWTEMELGGKIQRVKILESELVESPKRNASNGELLDSKLNVACNVGSVRLLRLQKAGSKAMSATDFLRGNFVPKGTQFE